MFYVPTLEQLTIPNNIKILLQSTSNPTTEDRNYVQIKFFKSSPRCIQQNVRKTRSIKTEPRNSTIKQTDRSMKQKQKQQQKQKLPRIRLDQALKLGVKGIMATKQLMPYLRRANQCNDRFLRNKQKHQRLKSQCHCHSHRNKVELQKYAYKKNDGKTQLKVRRDEEKLKPNFFKEQVKSDANKISPWQVYRLTKQNFYEF